MHFGIKMIPSLDRNLMGYRYRTLLEFMNSPSQIDAYWSVHAALFQNSQLWLILFCREQQPAFSLCP